MNRAALRAALVVIAAGTAAASFVASTGFAAAQGADVVHVATIPLTLEVSALAGAWVWHARRDPWGLAVFLAAFSAAVAINVAHAAGTSRTLMALYALPPAALIGAGHLFLRDAVARAEERAAQVAVLREELAPGVRDVLRGELRGPVRAQLRAELRAGLRREVEREVGAHAQGFAVAHAERNGHRNGHRNGAQRDGADGGASVARNGFVDLSLVREDARDVVAEHVAGGGDVHDDVLTGKVEAAIGLSRRTAQLRLQDVRAAAPEPAST